MICTEGFGTICVSSGELAEPGAPNTWQQSVRRKSRCQKSSPQAYTSPADLVTSTQQSRCCAQGTIPNQNLLQAQLGKEAPSWKIKPQLPGSSKFLLGMDQVASRCQSQISSASENVAQVVFGFFYYEQAEIGKQEHCDMNFLQV